MVERRLEFGQRRVSARCFLGESLIRSIFGSIEMRQKYGSSCASVETGDLPKWGTDVPRSPLVRGLVRRNFAQFVPASFA